MAKLLKLLIGSAVGAAAVYYLDPQHGNARRAKLRDQLDAARGRIRSPMLATGERTPAAPEPETDLTVLSRVESVLSGMPGFPRGNVELEVTGGRLVLRGEVESEERAGEIARAASGVKGVVGVENRLRAPGAPTPARAAPRRRRTGPTV